MGSTAALEERLPFELSANKAPDNGASPLDTFDDLITVVDPSDDVVEILEEAMEPFEEITGSIPPIELKRLRNIFAKELGEDVVDSALEDAGIEVD